MRRWILIVVAAAALGMIVAARVLDAGPRAAAPPLDEAPVTLPVSRGDVSQVVTAPGLAVGTREALVSMPVGGQLAELAVRPGEKVMEGQLLVRLDTARLQERLDRAEAELARARAEHAFQLDRARLEAQIATARLAERELQVPGLAAEAADVRAAESALAALRAGPDGATRAALEARVAQARAALDRLRAGPSQGDLIAAERELADAEAAVRQAQAAYDLVAWAPDISGRPESLQLERATNAYEAARARYDDLTAGADPAAIAAAEAALREAEARLAAEGRGPTTDEIARAEAAVARARAAYSAADAARAAGDETLDALRAERALAERALAFLEEGLDPRFEQAVADARAALEAAEIHAPFDGIVIETLAAPGESLAEGAPLLRLADPAAIELVTTVIEEDLPLVEIGQPAEIFFDASLEELPGRVTRIVPRRVPGADRPLYHVYLALDEQPPEIVAGMSADAAIVVARQENVLRLPRAVLRFSGADRAEVRLWTGETIEPREIRVGLRGDVYVEILEGIAEGERVVGE